jgi:LPS sulfotransferase NodH
VLQRRSIGVAAASLVDTRATVVGRKVSSKDMGRAYTRFLVLGEGRTGSNLLVQLLNSHPHIVCFREVFNWTHSRVDYQVPGYDEKSAKDVRFRRDDPIGLLQARVFCEWPATVEAVGFKLHYGHALGYEGLEEHLAADEGLHVIHLRRENALRTYVSFLNAQRTGEWERHAHDGLRSRVRKLVRTAGNVLARRDVSAPLVITPEEVREFAVSYALKGQRYDAVFAGHQCLGLTYESLADDRGSSLSSIARFLGVDAFEVAETTLRRQNPERLRDLIANYDELRKSFAGSPGEAWFDD